MRDSNLTLTVFDNGTSTSRPLPDEEYTAIQPNYSSSNCTNDLRIIKTGTQKKISEKQTLPQIPGLK